MNTGVKTGIRAGDLIVSCQTDFTSPFGAPKFIRAFALAALQGGAQGLRLEGAANIRAVQSVTALPIIGLVRRRVASYCPETRGLPLEVLQTRNHLVRRATPVAWTELECTR